MPLAEQQEPRWGGSWPKVGAREVQRGIWLADRRGERQEFWLGPGCGGGLGPPLPGPHSFLPGPQERPLLGRFSQDPEFQITLKEGKRKLTATKASFRQCCYLW